MDALRSIASSFSLLGSPEFYYLLSGLKVVYNLRVSVDAGTFKLDLERNISEDESEKSDIFIFFLNLSSFVFTHSLV